MVINYQTCMAIPYTVGSRVGIEGTDWLCIEESTFIGWTIESLEPVLRGPDGPMLNEGHFVQAAHFKTTPKPGQTRSENMLLAEYESIHPVELVGKNITHSRWCDDTFLALCDDKTYVKFQARCEQYGSDLELRRDDITVDDLNSLDVIDASVWQKCQEEQREIRMRRANLSAQRNFDTAVRNLGVKRAKELIKDFDAD